MICPFEIYLFRWVIWFASVTFLLTVLALIVFFIIRSKEQSRSSQYKDSLKDLAFANLLLSRFWLWFAFVTFLLTLLALIVLLILRAREHARYLSCSDNLTWIAVNIFWYYEHNGHFPPAHVEAQDGSRMHSWRALIGEEFKYEFTFSYDFREPWNGPNNSKLGDYRMSALACPSDSGTQRNKRLTNYFVIEGANTPFPATHTRSIVNIHDLESRSNTILVAEAIGLGIQWLEPRDLNFDDMSFMLNDPKHPSISSPHLEGPNALMADGSVRTLNPNISPEVLKTMLNIQEGAWRLGDEGEKLKEKKTGQH